MEEKKLKKEVIKKKINWKLIFKNWFLGCCLGLCIIGLLFYGLLFINSEFNVEIICNSGKINLDIEAINNIQNISCNDDYSYNKPKNFTCFKEDLQLKHIKLKEIDSVTCKTKINGKMPIILGLLTFNNY